MMDLQLPLETSSSASVSNEKISSSQGKSSDIGIDYVEFFSAVTGQSSYKVHTHDTENHK